MSFGSIIFKVNPLNGRYLYPQFVSNTRAKEGKATILRGHNSWKYQLANAKYLLVTLQGLHFQKIIVAKTPQGEEDTSSSLPSKNAVSVAAILDFKMAAKPGT